MNAQTKEKIQASIIRVLDSDPRSMTLNFLMHKVFQDLQERNDALYIAHKDFSIALQELLEKYWVGRTKHNRYYLDYLDYEESDEGGEGYIEVDFLTGHGYITVKRNYREYKKPSYFVHKKNINNAKWGDYVRFVELKNTKGQKFAHKDAVVKEILPKPKLS